MGVVLWQIPTKDCLLILGVFGGKVIGQVLCCRSNMCYAPVTLDASRLNLSRQCQLDSPI